MNSIKKFFVAMLSVALLAPVATYAQEQQAPEVKAVVYSDISFGKIKVSEEEGTLSGTYSLRGNMGQQNDIQLGLVVYGADNLMIDAVPVRNDLSLREGEVVNGTFRYEIPRYLSGTTTFALKAETSEGLPLAIMVIQTRELDGTGRAITCTEQDATIECSSKVDTSIEVSYGAGSLFSSTSNVETKQIKKGQKVTFTPDLPAGKYAAHIKAGNGETYTLILFVKGTYGTIRNIVVESTQKGEVHGVAVLYTSDFGSTLSVDLGNDCGSVTLPYTSATLEFTIKTSCTEGTLIANLVGADGNTLDSKTEAFSVVPVNAPVAEESSAMSPLVYGSLALLALITLGAYAYFRRKDTPTVSNTETPTPQTAGGATVVAVLGFLFFFAGVSQTNAAAVSLNYVCSPPTSCPLASTIYANMYDAGGGGPYAPGDSVTMSIVFSSDDNPQPVCSGACIEPLARLAVDRAVTSSSDVDIFANSYTRQDLRGGLVSADITQAAPSPLGTHYIYYGFGSGGYEYKTGSDPLVVQAYCPYYHLFDPGNGSGSEDLGSGELFPGQSVQLQNSPLSSPSKHTSSCTGKGGATCPPDPEPYQTSPYTATCYGPGVTPPPPPPPAPTVEVNFSFWERMFKVFALSN